nr:MAG: ORF1 [TTV-like mini virus]
MPYRRNYYQRRRRRWIYYRRPRGPFRRKWRRYRRRRWVRKRKLPYLKLKEWQPSCIKKCKITGTIPLYWGTPERFVNNYDSYEMTTAPPKLPSGGCFSIKNFSLQSLYAEHRYIRNIWTTSNTDLPLVRYTGCKFKIYRSEHVDTILTFDNNLPLASNQDMYLSMQPSVHKLIKHKTIIPKLSKGENKRKYKILKIKPPKPMINKWYFQQDITNIPLCQIRTSACSLDEWYVNYKTVSTTMTVNFINPGCITNTYFNKYYSTGWYCRKLDSGNKIYLVSFKDKAHTWENITFLGNTLDNQAGQSPKEAGLHPTSPIEEIITKFGRQQWGNPFYKNYLSNQWKVYFFNEELITLLTKWQQTPQGPVPVTYITETQITNAIRYNPLSDEGKDTKIYFKPTNQPNENWDPPTNINLMAVNLPWWILTFGFVDFHKKLKQVKNIDTEQILVLQGKLDGPITKIFPLIDNDFINGKSPYENTNNPLDNNRWHLCFQFQQITTNNIGLSGPGSIKTPTLQCIQAKADYTFYFKWGGNPPPMPGITDPTKQPHFNLPFNITKTNSLQNPATSPAYSLYTFDYRRGELTSKAIERMQKDFPIKKTFITDTDRFQPPIQTTTQDSSESSTEEEEEEIPTLLNKLQRQRLKQKQLKYLILKNLGYLPKLE